MVTRISLRHRVLMLGCLLLLAGRAQAQLPVNSPFQPLPSSTASAAAPESTLKYGGYIRTSEGAQYRFTDSTRKAAAFVKMNQRDDALGVTVRRHDPESQTVTVEYQGRTQTLAEPKAKIVSAGASPAPLPVPLPRPVAPSASAPSPAATQSVSAASNTSEEQRRLETVVADIQARRLAREQQASTARR